MSGLKPLGEISRALDEIGFNVTYSYDDLVFIEHSPFLIRFDGDDAGKIHFYAHHSFRPAKAKRFLSKVGKKFRFSRFRLVNSGTFEIKEAEGADSSISVTFHEKVSAEA